MSNPFQKGFAPPSRGEWCRRTLWWLKRNAGLDRPGIALMLDVMPHRVTCLCSPSINANGAIWFPELLGALVAGWRPSKDWAWTASHSRQSIVDRAVEDVLGFSEARFDVWFPLGAPRWKDAIFEGVKETRVPVRFAVIADALVAGVVPCGLQFGEWEP